MRSMLAILTYKRYETADRIVIVFNSVLMYLRIGIATIGCIACILNEFIIGITALLTIIVLQVLYGALTAPLFREVTAAIKNGKAQITGSKYSLQNPLTVTIAK
ncbi:MAG: hypothetical protein K0R22_1109 [Sporomusa sp.]|nr:hypothetical protein [Sporomusa sp.]